MASNRFFNGNNHVSPAAAAHPSFGVQVPVTAGAAPASTVVYTPTYIAHNSPSPVFSYVPITVYSNMGGGSLPSGFVSYPFVPVNYGHGAGAAAAPSPSMPIRPKSPQKKGFIIDLDDDVEAESTKLRVDVDLDGPNEFNNEQIAKLTGRNGGLDGFVQSIEHAGAGAGAGADPSEEWRKDQGSLGGAFFRPSPRVANVAAVGADNPAPAVNAAPGRPALV